MTPSLIKVRKELACHGLVTTSIIAALVAALAVLEHSDAFAIAGAATGLGASLYLIVAALNDLLWPTRRGPHRRVAVSGDVFALVAGVGGVTLAVILFVTVIGTV